VRGVCEVYEFREKLPKYIARQDIKLAETEVGEKYWRDKILAQTFSKEMH
jgi:hypothetical protein